MSQVATEVVVDPAVPMLTENALVVLKDRYLNRKDGVLTEEPFGLFSRVARYVASAEQNDADEELWYQRFLNGMLEGRFMPNSPTLMNAGRNNNLLSACYVLPVGDSIDNIFDSVKATGLVQRAGGGCVAGDAQVFVRGKGLTRIADLCAILPRPDVDGVFVDVKDIEVLTADNFGKICFRPVTRVWRFVDKKTRNIATSYGTLTASKEHPCFVVGKDGPSFVPAEDTGAGTALVRPTPYTNQIELDQRAYLAGVIVGDGLVSEGKNGRPDRLRIFSGDEATLNVVKDYVFNLCGKPYSVHASGATVYELTVLDKSLIAEAKQWIGVGAKNDIPGFNPASLHEAASYIAGLIDSDGHVEASRPRVSISSVHRELCERVQGVLGVLGCPTRLRERLPGKRGTRNCYEVTFAAHDVPWLPALLNRKFRKDRLVNWLASPDSRVVQTPDWVRDKILASGKFDSTRSDTRGTLGSGPDVQSLVYSQTKSTSRRNLSSIADNLDDSAISHLANAISVKEVTSDVATDLYDLTVSEFSRYVVVCGGLPAIVHNTGYAFDELRPCGQYVASSGGKSSGPLSFWRVFSEATSAIQQGSFRRGANMAVMSVHHPDIVKFLFAKQDLKQFENYNISVKVPDSFMEQLKENPAALHVVSWKDKNWYIPRAIVDKCKTAVADGISGKVHPRTLDTCYQLSDLVPDTTTDISDCLSVGDIFDIILKNAWQTGEPGLFFISRVRETEALPDVMPIQATNPCGEQPLGPWESCNLASINLAKYVKPITDRITEQGSFDDVDMVALGDDVDMVVRFLDNVVTVNNHPVKEIVAANDANRRIGLGIMGFADMLVQLGIRYDSPEGIEFGRNLMSFINNRAVNASINLAKERGAFPNYDKSVWPKRLNGAPIRNACVTTVAPTGTISIIADCSGGIEPLFSFAFYRYVLGDKKLVEVNKNFKALAKLYGFDKPEVYEYVATNGTVQGCPDIPDNIKNILRSARDISPEDHIKMQAAFQEHVTSAISKTINLPESASLDDVRTAYITAYNLRCKGVTVYRDNCRAGQPMALKQAAKDKEEVPPITNKKLSTMPTLMPGLYYKHKCTYGTMHINVSFESLPDGTWRECQVFFEIGRSGDPLNAMLDAVARLCSKLLQTGAGLEVIIDQLSGGKSLGEKHNVNGLTTSLPNEIAAGLLAYYAATIDCRNSDGLITCMPWSGLGLSASDGNNCSSPSSTAPTSVVKDLSRKINAVDMLSTPCPSPNCRGTLVIAEGCKKCYSCGQSSC